jgi:hypothetical protein
VPRDALSVAGRGQGRRALCRGSVFAGDRLTLELELDGGLRCSVETAARSDPPPQGSPVDLAVDESLLRFV